MTPPTEQLSDETWRAPIIDRCCENNNESELHFCNFQMMHGTEQCSFLLNCKGPVEMQQNLSNFGKHCITI